MALEQLGGPRCGVMSRESRKSDQLGIVYCLALDREQQLLGWAVTGDHGSHVRRYEKLHVANEGKADECIFAKDIFETMYWFGREMTDEQRVAWALWQRERTDTDFPVEDFTLEEAAAQMGFDIVPPDWTKPADLNEEVSDGAP